MSKNFSRILLAPIMGLLPFTQGLAVATAPSHPIQNPPHAQSTSVRDMVIQGKMVDKNTIQINAADRPTPDQANQIRVITLMDDHGQKQRFILLPPDRTQWVLELQKYHGSIKEFNFYSIVDQNGHTTDLLASKRIVEAPANQLTVVFPSRQDALDFFTEARQKQLEQAGFISPDLQSQLYQETQTINNTINEIIISTQDQHKANIMEPITLFPTISVIVITTVLSETPLHEGD